VASVSDEALTVPGPGVVWVASAGVPKEAATTPDEADAGVVPVTPAAGTVDVVVGMVVGEGVVVVVVGMVVADGAVAIVEGVVVVVVGMVVVVVTDVLAPTVTTVKPDTPCPVTWPGVSPAKV
jgi:hypothetical protein